MFPSGVSAFVAACHAVGTGLARPRWDLLAFGYCPLQEGKEREEGWLGEKSSLHSIEGIFLPSRAQVQV